MPSREVEMAARAANTAVLRAKVVEQMLAAVRVVAGRARSNHMPCDRAIALIAAVLDGYAVAEVTAASATTCRVSIVAAPDAPSEVRALLEQAQLPTLDPVAVQVSASAPQSTQCTCTGSPTDCCSSFVAGSKGLAHTGHISGTDVDVSRPVPG